MKREHKKAGWFIELPDTLTQGHIEKFDLELARLVYLRGPSGSRNGAELRAAIGAGWIASPECIRQTVQPDGGKQRVEFLFDGVKVEDMAPNHVAWLAQYIRTMYDEATEIPPN